jgi:hypothetical protein
MFPLEFINALASLGVGAVLGGLAITYLYVYMRDQVKQERERGEAEVKREKERGDELATINARQERMSERLITVVENSTTALGVFASKLDALGVLNDLHKRIEKIEKLEKRA